MRSFFLLALFILTSGFGDSFITKFEYGEYLYDNPRGIGCSKCHGEKAEGMLIATYKESADSNVTKQLRGPAIVNINKNRLQKTLFSKHPVMPTYNLTKAEIEALHIYLNNLEK